MRGKPRWQALPNVLSAHAPADDLSMWSALASQDVLERLGTQMHGLTQEGAAQRLREYGLNRVANGHHEGCLLYTSPSPRDS